jgi:hypothetical protein
MQWAARINERTTRSVLNEVEHDADPDRYTTDNRTLLNAANQLADPDYYKAAPDTPEQLAAKRRFLFSSMAGPGVALGEDDASGLPGVPDATSRQRTLERLRQLGRFGALDASGQLDAGDVSRAQQAFVNNSEAVQQREELQEIVGSGMKAANARNREQLLARFSADAQTLASLQPGSESPSWWNSRSVLGGVNASVNGFLSDWEQNTDSVLGRLALKGAQFRTDMLLPATNGELLLSAGSVLFPPLRAEGLLAERSAVRLGDDVVSSVSLRQTGARQVIDPNGGLRAYDLAEVSYDLIRRDSSDIAAIVKNTGWSETRIASVKDHVFFNEHTLDSGLRRFDADPEMLNAWSRLTLRGLREVRH